MFTFLIVELLAHGDLVVILAPSWVCWIHGGRFWKSEILGDILLVCWVVLWGFSARVGLQCTLE